MVALLDGAVYLSANERLSARGERALHHPADLPDTG